MEAIAPLYTFFLYRSSKMFLRFIRIGAKIIKSHKKGIVT